MSMLRQTIFAVLALIGASVPLAAYTGFYAPACTFATVWTLSRHSLPICVFLTMSLASSLPAPLVGAREIDYALIPPAKVPTRMNETLPDEVAGSALMRGTGGEALQLVKRARLQLRALSAGECVFRAGDPADAIYLLLGARRSGEGLHVDPLVQIEFKPPSGKRSLRFERIVQGEVFGELELLEQGLATKAAKRTTSAFALTPSSIVPLPLTLIGALIEADPVFRARLTRIGAQRLLATLMQEHDKVHAFPDLLLADWLVELSADIGIAEGNRVRFPRKIAQEHIAADLGVSRETISRRLNEWERSGLLRTGARSQQIEILDYQRISRLASLRSARSRAALERTIGDIDAAIACGDLIRARNIGLDILRYYPSSPELHHRTALAAARSGDAQGALELLARSGLPMAGSLDALEDAVRKARKNPFLPMDRIVERSVRRRWLWRGRVGARSTAPTGRARRSSRLSWSRISRRSMRGCSRSRRSKRSAARTSASRRAHRSRPITACSSTSRATIRGSTPPPWR